MSRPLNQTDKERLVDSLRYAIDCIGYYERIAILPNCNDCGNALNGCMYLPKWGEEVRINCPHWESRKPTVKAWDGKEVELE